MDLGIINPSFLVRESVNKMAKSRLKRRTINSSKNKENMRYFDLIIVGIASQIIVLIGSLNTVNMNGIFNMLILMLGDVCLACGVDYYESKQHKNKRKK